MPPALRESHRGGKGACKLLSERGNVNTHCTEYSEVFGGNYFISGSVFNSIPRLLISGKLKIPPTLYEVGKAIKQMKNYKASGAGGIPAEILRSAEEGAHHGSLLSSRSQRTMEAFQMTSVVLGGDRFKARSQRSLGAVLSLSKVLAKGGQATL